MGSDRIWRSQTLSGIVVWCWPLEFFRAPARFVFETDGVVGFARTADCNKRVLCLFVSSEAQENGLTKLVEPKLRGAFHRVGYILVKVSHVYYSVLLPALATFCKCGFAGLRTRASFSIKRLVLEFEKQRITADRILPQSRLGAEHLGVHLKKRRRLGKGEARVPASGSLY